MDGPPGILSVNSPCRDVLLRIRRLLESAGLHALETFDLQSARLPATGCTCPHHGSAECDCQMVVLMIYGKEPVPAPLVLHGSDGHTWISFPEGPNRDLDLLIEASIESGLYDDSAAEGL